VTPLSSAVDTAGKQLSWVDVVGTTPGATGKPVPAAGVGAFEPVVPTNKTNGKRYVNVNGQRSCADESYYKERYDKSSSMSDYYSNDSYDRRSSQEERDATWQDAPRQQFKQYPSYLRGRSKSSRAVYDEAPLLTKEDSRQARYCTPEFTNQMKTPSSHKKSGPQGMQKISVSSSGPAGVIGANGVPRKNVKKNNSRVRRSKTWEDNFDKRPKKSELSAYASSDEEAEPVPPTPTSSPQIVPESPSSTETETSLDTFDRFACTPMYPVFSTNPLRTRPMCPSDFEKLVKCHPEADFQHDKYKAVFTQDVMFRTSIDFCILTTINAMVMEYNPLSLLTINIYGYESKPFRHHPMYPSMHFVRCDRDSFPMRAMAAEDYCVCGLDSDCQYCCTTYPVLNVVTPGVAITPEQIARLAKRGKTVCFSFATGKPRFLEYQFKVDSEIVHCVNATGQYKLDLPLNTWLRSDSYTSSGFNLVIDAGRIIGVFRPSLVYFSPHEISSVIQPINDDSRRRLMIELPEALRRANMFGTGDNDFIYLDEELYNQALIWLGGKHHDADTRKQLAGYLRTYMKTNDIDVSLVNDHFELLLSVTFYESARRRVRTNSLDYMAFETIKQACNLTKTGIPHFSLTGFIASVLDYRVHTVTVWQRRLAIVVAMAFLFGVFKLYKSRSFAYNFIIKFVVRIAVPWLSRQAPANMFSVVKPKRTLWKFDSKTTDYTLEPQTVGGKIFVNGYHASTHSQAPDESNMPNSSIVVLEEKECDVRPATFLYGIQLNSWAAVTAASCQCNELQALKNRVMKVPNFAVRNLAVDFAYGVPMPRTVDVSIEEWIKHLEPKKLKLYNKGYESAVPWNKFGYHSAFVKIENNVRGHFTQESYNNLCPRLIQGSTPECNLFSGAFFYSYTHTLEEFINNEYCDPEYILCYSHSPDALAEIYNQKLDFVPTLWVSADGKRMDASVDKTMNVHMVNLCEHYTKDGTLRHVVSSNYHLRGTTRHRVKYVADQGVASGVPWTTASHCTQCWCIWNKFKETLAYVNYKDWEEKYCLLINRMICIWPWLLPMGKITGFWMLFALLRNCMVSHWKLKNPTRRSTRNS